MKMRLSFYLANLIILLAFGCASLKPDYSVLEQGEQGESETGLGASPFVLGGKFKYSDGNAMANAIDDNAADIAVFHLINGLIKCNGAGSCTVADDADILDEAEASATYEPILTGAKVLPDGVTATTQGADSIAEYIATGKYVHSMASFRGSNMAPDPNFYLAANGLGTWTTITDADYGPGVFGAYGEDAGTTGVLFEHAGKKYDYIRCPVKIPIQYGAIYNFNVSAKLSADYADAGDNGARVYLQAFDKDGVAGGAFGVQTGVSTLNSWLETSGVDTVTDTDAAYAILVIYIGDAGAAGTGSVQIDYVSVTKVDSYYSASTHGHTGYQTDLDLISQAEAEAGTAETERVLNALRLHQSVAGYLENQYGHGTYLAAQPSGNWIGKTAYVNGYTAGYDPMDLHTAMSYDGAYEVYVATAATWNATNLKLLRTIDGTAYFGSIVIPTTTSGDQTLSAGKIGLKTDEDAFVIHGGAAGEVQDEAVISLLQQIIVPFDPTNRYDNTTNHIVDIMKLGDSWPHGFTLTQWSATYVDGDPTTELDADLICDTTPDFNPAANATVMDAIDTTAGASGADSGFDSSTCANGAYMYIRINADPVDDPVTVHFEMEGFANED